MCIRDSSDTLQDGANRGPAVTCSISMADINASLKTDDLCAGNQSSEDSAKEESTEQPNDSSGEEEY